MSGYIIMLKNEQVIRIVYMVDLLKNQHKIRAAVSAGKTGFLFRSGSLRVALSGRTGPL